MHDYKVKHSVLYPLDQTSYLDLLLCLCTGKELRWRPDSRCPKCSNWRRCWPTIRTNGAWHLTDSSSTRTPIWPQVPCKCARVLLLDHVFFSIIPFVFLHTSIQQTLFSHIGVCPTLGPCTTPPVGVRMGGRWCVVRPKQQGTYVNGCVRMNFPFFSLNNSCKSASILCEMK